MHYGRAVCGHAALACLGACVLAAAPMRAAAQTAQTAQTSATSTDERVQERVQVADPYIDLRTGPGRGYPVFFVAAREEWIVIQLRHTDWFKVQTAGGKVGWVQREQLQRTLTEAGGRKTFRDLALDDYLRRRVELGASWGHFKSEPMLKLWSSFKLSETLSLEGSIGQVQGVFSGTNLWHINLVTQPWSDRRVSPFFAVGLGKFRNIPNTSLVGAVITDSNLANAAVGVRYHLGERFVMRLDYSIYTALIADTRSTEYRAVTAGFSFYF